MPGVVMDNADAGGARWEPGVDGSSYGSHPSFAGANKSENPTVSKNTSAHINGTSVDSDRLNPNADASTKDATMQEPPPELAHITQGFFPFTKLINRSVQLCWNDLSDLFTELAELRTSSQTQPSSSISINGKSAEGQSPENVHKKVRILEFVHGKRADFIKLLVLSQWSRQAADVSKLIDIQGFIRSRHQAYVGALQWVGDMKRDLVRAQIANPDLKTALEILSKGKVVAMSDLGYKPPKPLTMKSTLKKLQKLNRIISVRLVLYDQLPYSFQTYRVHDGRVTFYVPEEFELDLSVGEENPFSQFFFVDIRFLFSPSSPILKGWVLNELDMKVNDVLRDNGLAGCFDFLHDLVLTNKVQALFKQAANLARGPWSDVLRVELLHRILVVQYWASKPGSKSWIEIGIKSGYRASDSGHAKHRGLPHLGLRWMRDGQEVNCGNIHLDTASLSMECILRSVIALHISHILVSAYGKLGENLLFSAGKLSLQARLSMTEPGNCELSAQLTLSRHLRVSIEPISGACVLSATPNILERPESDRSPDKAADDEIVSRVSRLRCIAAIEEIESNMKMLGFETVHPRALRLDARKIFPSNVLRFSFFWHQLWGRNWVLAAASSMDSDNWWLVQLRQATPTRPDNRTSFSVDAGANLPSIVRSAQIVSSAFHPVRQQLDYVSFADLGHCLTGILAVHANVRYLTELQYVTFHPSLQRLQVESSLRVPDIFIHYETASLPPALQLKLPAGFKGKSSIKNTIRLTYYGIDPRTRAAIMVAYGNLSIPVRALEMLIPRCNDRSLVFQLKGSGFALRLLATAGHSVIVDLIKTLQRLECVLSIVESIQRKKMAVQTFSLSQVAFAYARENDFCATVHVEVHGSLFMDGVDPAGLSLQNSPLSRVHLTISFDRKAPHRRIQESLTAILNNESGTTGFDSAVEILSLTLPLLRAFDRITANPSLRGPLKTQITVRNAISFHIHYPAQKFRFRLAAGQYLGRVAWILTEKSPAQDKSKYAQLATKLQDGLYNSRGDGWRGLGNGVVAEVDKVGNLLFALDKCFDSASDTPATTLVAERAKHGNTTSNNQATTTRNAGLETGLDSNAAPHAAQAGKGSNNMRAASKDVETITIE